jgi:tRNA pseudouridine13 synthase
MNFSFTWPRAHNFDPQPGVLKSVNEDFVVLEKLPEEPSGEGEHLWITIEKNGQNTAWVARQLAKWAGLQQRDVSYAGLKDRHAVTTQTFSVHLPGKEAPSPHLIHIDGVKLISYKRHTRKLKTGQLIGNHFTIRIRNNQQSLESLQNNWQTICEQGVPNYFGPQRFGREGGNVSKGVDWILGNAKMPRQFQSIYLSSVRSYLFNELLADRVKNRTWNTLLKGDFAQFTAGKTGFYCEEVAENDEERCLNGQISPSASLVGLSKDEYPALDERERTLLEPYSEIIAALESRKVMRHFRKLRVIPETPGFSVAEGDPVFSFFLPAGAFATTVINEVVDWQASDSGDWNE